MAWFTTHLANVDSGDGPIGCPYCQDTGALRVFSCLAWLLQPRGRRLRTRTTSHLLRQDGSILGEWCGRLVPGHIHVGSVDSGRRLGDVSGARTAASDDNAPMTLLD